MKPSPILVYGPVEFLVSRAMAADMLRRARLGKSEFIAGLIYDREARLAFIVFRDSAGMILLLKPEATT